MNECDELYHYGVKGMRWGVRRYQNYDGSYTKAGLARFKTASDSYDIAKETKRKTREAYKNGTASKSQYKSATAQVKKYKKEMTKAYKGLKTDKMADQGKELRKRGKTITGNLTTNAIAQAAVVAGSGIVNRVLSSTLGNQRVANIASATIAVGGTIANGIMVAKTNYDNKRLRSFYTYNGGWQYKKES